MAADSASRSRYSDEQLQEQVTLGRAIFSTRKDTLKPHAVTDRKDAPIVLRTDPEEDITELLVNLQKRFPRDCRRVTLPILDIFNYFDHQDTHIHGFGVCEHVLRKLGTENEERWTTILPKAKSWALENVQRFDLLEPNEDVTFSKGEVAMYNPAFLDDFSFCIIRLRAQKRSEERKAASQSKQPGSVDHVVASGAENPRPYSINGNTTNGASGRVPRIQEEPTPFVGAPTAVVPTSAGGQHQFSATSVYPAAGTMALTGPQFGGQPVPVTYQLEQPQLPINNYLQPQPGIGVPAHGARGQRNFSRETSGGSYNGQQGISPNSEQQLQPFYQAGPPHDVSQPRSGFMQPNGPSGLSPYGSMGVPALQAPMAYEHQMAQQGMPYPSPRGSGQPFINDVRQDQALQNRRNFDSNGSTSLQDTPHRRNKASPYTRDNPSQRQRQTLRDGNRRGGFSGQRHRNFSPEQAYEQNTYVGIGLHQPNNFASTSQRVMSSQGGYQGQPPFPYDAPGPAFMGNQPQFNGGQYQNSFVQPTMQPVPQSFQPVWYAAPPPERSNAQTSPPGEVRRSTNPEISVTAPTQSSEESKDVSQSGDSRATDTPRPSKPHPQKKYTDDVRFLQTDNGSSQQALSVAPKADIQEPESQPSTEGAPASTTVNDEATKVQVNDLATPQDGTVRRKSREYLGYALDGHHSQDSAGTSQQLNRLVNNATQVSASSTLQGPRASSNGSKGLQKSLESQAGAKSRLPFDHTSQANDASHSFPTSNNNAYMRHHYYTDQSGDRIRDHLKLWVSSRGLTDKKLREILQSCPGIVDIQMKFPFSWESDQDPRSKPFAFIQFADPESVQYTLRHLQGLVIDCPENYNRHPVNVDFAYAIRSSFQHTNHVNDRSTPHYGPRDVRTPSGHFPGGGGHQNQESARSVSSQTQDGVQNNTTPSKKKKKTSKSSRSKVGMSQTGSNDSLAAGDSEHGTTAKGDASAKQRGNSLKQSGTDGKAPATNPNGPHARDTVATSRDSHDTAASRDKAQKSTGADPPKGRQSERPSSRANKKEQSTGSDSKSKAQDNAAQSTGAKNKKHRPEKSGSTALETLTKPSQPPPTTEAPPGKQKSVQNPSSTKGNAKAKDSKDVPSNTGKKSSTSDKKETSKPSEATTPAVAQSSQPRWADVIPSSDDPKSPPRPSKGSKKPSAVDQGRSKTGKAKHTKQNPNQSQAAPKPESTKLITDASPNSKNQQVSVDSESQIKTGQSGSNGAAKEKQRALSNPQPQASVPPLKHGTSQDQGKKTQKGVGKAANHGRSRTPEAPKPKNDNPHIPRATSNIELSNPYSALSDTNKSTPIESRSSSSKQSDKLVSFAAPVATPSPKAISCMDGTNSLSPSPKTPTRLRETISHVETPTSASPPVMTHKRKKSKAISVSSSVAESEATTVIKTDETPPTNEVVSRMTNPEMGSPGRVTEIGPKADQTAADQEPDVDSAPPHAKDETIEPSSTSPPESKDQEPPTSSPTTTNEVRAGLLKAIKDYDSSASETTDNHPNETTATASPTDPPTKEKRTHNRKSKKSKTSQTSESNSVDLNALSTDNDVENMQSASTRDAESPEPTEEITRVSSGGYSRFQDEMTEAEKFQWVTDHIASSGRPCKEVRAWDLAVAPYVKIYTVKTMADLERDMKQNVYQRYARITREFEENRKRRALPTDSKPLSQRRKKTQKRIPTPPDHKSDNQGGSDAGLTITESQNEAQSSRSVDVNKPIGNTVKAFVPTKLNDDPSPTDPTGTPQVSSATNRPYSDETTPKITLPSDFVDRAPSSDEEARDYIKRAQDPAHWQGVLAKSKQKAKEMFPEVDDEMLDSENQELEKIRKDFAEWLTDEDTDGEPKSLPAARERRVTSSPTELHSPVSPRASQRSRRPVLINTPSAPPNTPASASKTSSRRQSHSVVGGGVTPALDDLKEDSPSKEASNDSLKSSSSTLKGDEAEASKQLTLDGLPPRMRMVTELLSAGSLNFEEIMSRLSTLPEQEDQEDFEAFKRSRENEIATDDGTTSPSKRKDSSASKNSNGDAIATDDGTASALERQASKTSKNSNEDAIVTDDTSALERQASKVSKSSNEDAIVTDDGTAWPTLGPKSTRSQSSTTKRSESPMSYSKLFSEVAGSSPARGGRTNSLTIDASTTTSSPRRKSTLSRTTSNTQASSPITPRDTKNPWALPAGEKVWGKENKK